MSTDIQPHEEQSNFSLCNEANEIHIQWEMIVTQIIVVLINLLSTVITGIFAHFVFNDQTKHMNYRGLLISITVAVSLRAAFTLARAMRILTFIAIKGILPCALVTEKTYCKFETEMKFLPLTAGGIGFAFLIFERTFASIFFKKYENLQNKNNKIIAIFLAFLPWLITVALMIPMFFPSSFQEGYVSYCGTLTGKDYNKFMLQHWEIPAIGFCVFICLFVLLFTVRKRKRVIIDMMQERFNARIQFDKNLIFAQKVVFITLFAVLCFSANYGIITLSQMVQLSVPHLFLVKELTNITFGIYGFIFVYINIYKVDVYKNHFSNLFRKFCFATPFIKLNLCYSTRNSAALTTEGKEYFSYYRTAWQCEKRKTFLGWTYA